MNIYAQKFNKLDEMAQLLEKHDLLELTQDRIDNSLVIIKNN
jgi:hypothetical protein